MAARTPRRSFATPFVVTLAAAPACYVQSTPAPQTGPSRPPPQTTEAPPPAQTPPAQPGDQKPPPVIVNPPRPTDPQTQPPPAPSVSRWTVYKAKDGSCMAAIKVECQPQATCNPPPPFKYECPTNLQVEPQLAIVSSDGGKSCFVDFGPMKCPPGAICNPPPPRQVTCPKR
jgi:hypothetical protein